MRRVAIIGAHGQFGRALVQAFAAEEVAPWTHEDLDVTDLDGLRAAVEAWRPHVLINTAAFHHVDGCEADPDRAFRTNALGARNVAAAAEAVGAAVVYISTDQVFGENPAHRPWTEFDPVGPLNIYGRSKVAGEELTRAGSVRHFIIRVSGLFGPGGSRSKGGNFVEKILRQAEDKPEIRVVHDVLFSPTFTGDAAAAVAAVVRAGAYGTFHMVNAGVTSWFDLAAETLRLAGRPVPLVPMTTAELNLPARRPTFSALDAYHLRLGGFAPLRPWAEALADYLQGSGMAVAGRPPAGGAGR